MTKQLDQSITPLALVLGLGASGVASVRYLLERGWRVRAADTRNELSASATELVKTYPELEVYSGAFTESLLRDVTLLVMSPGLSLEYGAAAPLVRQARQDNIDIVGEIELFARELAHLEKTKRYRPIVIGITGTNGKTTTTVLTSKMVAQAGYSVKAAGNIGPNALTELVQADRLQTLPDVWVLELSSFQLATTSSLVLNAAAVLNITEDHLDWHGAIENYAAAKEQIAQHTLALVVNRDDRMSSAMGVRAQARGVSVLRFGEAAPEFAGDFGLSNKANLQWLSMRPLDDVSSSSSTKNIQKYQEETLVMPEGALKIQGRHNTMNALAALGLISAAGLPLAPAIKALEEYRGEAHRVQFVLRVGQVDFIDDSKGTNVGAVVAAVKGFAAQGKKIAILLGGDGKGQDFSPLNAALSGVAVAAAVIGKDKDSILSAIDKAVVARSFMTLDAAVSWLFNEAKMSDDSVSVLLSPACASWDMFKDYADRSAQFIACAKALAASEKEQ